MVFPVVVYGCECSTIKKAEQWRIYDFELWCWRRHLRVPWIVRRSSQSILKEISLQYSLERLILKLKLQYFGHLIRITNTLDKNLMMGKIEGRRRRGWQDEMVGCYHQLKGHEFEQALRDGEENLACLQTIGSQEVRHDWATEQCKNIFTSTGFHTWIIDGHPPKRSGFSVSTITITPRIPTTATIISLFGLKIFKFFPSKDTKVSLQLLAKNRSWVFKLYVKFFFNFVFSHQIHVLKNMLWILDHFFPLTLRYTGICKEALKKIQSKEVSTQIFWYICFERLRHPPALCFRKPATKDQVLRFCFY